MAFSWSLLTVGSPSNSFLRSRLKSDGRKWMLQILPLLASKLSFRWQARIQLCLRPETCQQTSWVAISLTNCPQKIFSRRKNAVYPACICPHPLFMKNNHYRWQLGAKTRKDIIAGAVRSLRFKDFPFLSLLSKVKQDFFTGDANTRFRFNSPGEDKIGNFEWQVLLDTFQIYSPGSLGNLWKLNLIPFGESQTATEHMKDADFFFSIMTAESQPQRSWNEKL